MSGMQDLASFVSCGNAFPGSISNLSWSGGDPAMFKISLRRCRQSTLNCVAGYYCEPDSLSPKAALCPAGQYSLVGAEACSPCAQGRFGSSPGLTSSTCSGPCAEGKRSVCVLGVSGSSTPFTRARDFRPPPPLPVLDSGWLLDAGRYGTPGQVSPQCTNHCSAGYVCPEGSTNATAVPSPVGRYSTAGLGIDCPAGTYGSTPGLATSACSGLCAAGRWGLPGAVVPACSGPCAAG